MEQQLIGKGCKENYEILTKISVPFPKITWCNSAGQTLGIFLSTLTKIAELLLRRGRSSLFSWWPRAPREQVSNMVDIRWWVVIKVLVGRSWFKLSETIRGLKRFEINKSIRKIDYWLLIHMNSFHYLQHQLCNKHIH